MSESRRGSAADAGPVRYFGDWWPRRTTDARRATGGRPMPIMRPHLRIAAARPSTDSGVVRDVAAGGSRHANGLGEMFQQALVDALEAAGYPPRKAASPFSQVAGYDARRSRNARPNTAPIRKSRWHIIIRMWNICSSPIPATMTGCPENRGRIRCDEAQRRWHCWPIIGALTPYMKTTGERPQTDHHGLLENPDWSTLYLWQNGAPVEEHIQAAVLSSIRPS